MLLGFGGGEQRRAAVDVAGIDRRTLGEEEFDELDLAAARGVRERTGAAAVARQQRSAGVEELARQSLAAFVGGREQRHIDLHRYGLGFDELIVALDLTAVPLGARLQILRARRRECDEGGEGERTSDGAERAADHRVRPFNSGCLAARR